MNTVAFSSCLIFAPIGQWSIRWHTSDSRPARIGNVAKRLKFRLYDFKKIWAAGQIYGQRFRKRGQKVSPSYFTFAHNNYKAEIFTDNITNKVYKLLSQFAFQKWETQK
jgi:hypothetical protein